MFRALSSIDERGTGHMLFMDDYVKTFTTIDADGDGLITATELQALMTRLGQTLDDDAATTMIGFIDTDGDGKVTRDELQVYLSRL